MEQTHRNQKNNKAAKPNKSSRLRWTENAIKALLSFLLENKEKLEELKYTRGAISNPEGVQLWLDAEAFLQTYNFEQTYSNIQIANKWKNLVDNYKVFFKKEYIRIFYLSLIIIFYFKTQLAESKKSGGPPITIQYKEEIEAILDKNRPTLNPKSCIDSSKVLSKKEESKESDDDQESFEIDKEKEPLYEFPKIGRNHTNKRKNKGTEINLDDQDKKKHRNNGSNLENTIQKWLEKQEVRQMESDKKREEQRLELLKLKQQSDMLLFGMLNNLTNCLRSNRQSEGIY